VKVLLINHFPLQGSGSGTYTRNIASALVQKGHEACIAMPENTAEYSLIDSIPTYPVFFTDENGKKPTADALDFNFPCFTTHPRSLQTFYDLNDEQLNAYIDAFASEVQKAIEEFKPDIIHAQHVWLLAWVAKNTGLPYVITSHGTDFIGYKKDERFRKYADEAAKDAKKIITISKDNTVLAKEILTDVENKTIQILNGYDPSIFYPSKTTKEEIFDEYNISPTKYMVLFSGKLTNFKGIDILLEAAKLYESEHPNEITTLLAGDGELLEELKAKAEELKLQNVHFLGFQQPSLLRKLYSATDVSVVPSRREPFGLVALEALACGSPVVATNQGGLPDIVNNEVGALVNVDDSIGLAQAIMAEIFNPDKDSKRFRATQYAVENFSQTKLIDGLIDIYHKVLEPL